MYYPLAEKYQSLYPRAEPRGDEDDGKAVGFEGKDKRNPRGQKPPLWPLIERAMTESTLEALRDGNGDRVVSVNTKPKVSIGRKAAEGAEAKQINDTNRVSEAQLEWRALPDNKDEAMSDGGFFEE